MKYGIQKFEFHLVGHNFLVRLDNSSFPKILDYRNKSLPDKQLLRLKNWFTKYDFTVQHIKGDKNLIPDLLSRPHPKSNSSSSSILVTSLLTIPVTSMAPSLPFIAFTKKSFPFNITFSSQHQIQDFATKFLFRYFMKVHQHKPYNFPSFNPDKLFLTGLTIDPFVSIIEDELWYLWCLTVLYATKIIFPVQYILCHLFDPSQTSSLLWTLFEWFSPLSWWRKQLQSICDKNHLNILVHQPYFQHPVTKLFWTQHQAYEWIIVPHPFPFLMIHNWLTI